MEVKESNGSLITNCEVMHLLGEMKHVHKNNHPLATIVYEMNKALHNSPASLQTPQHIESLLAAMKPFGLTPAEMLQVTNLRPTTPVEIQLIVEECEERLSEEKVEQLIAVIEKHLPAKVTNLVPNANANLSDASNAMETDA